MAQTALITGASSGIGREFAHQLHCQGYNLILVARRQARLEALCKEFNSQRNESAEYVVADLARYTGEGGLGGLQDVEDLIAERQIDLLINNAGFGSFGVLSDLDLKREEEMVLLNCVAPLRLTHAILSQMKQRGSGAIVNISSLGGLQPMPYMSTYCATKAFDLFFSLGLHYELKREGITVLAVCPGQTETEFGEVARGPGDELGFEGDKVGPVVADSLRALKYKLPFVVPGRKAVLLYWLFRFFPLKLRIFYAEKLMRSSLK